MEFRQFTSTEDVTFDDVLDVLAAWQQGRITRSEAVAFGDAIDGLLDAEQREGVRTDFSKDDPRSVLFNVVLHLSWVYSLPVWEEDIPAMMEFLRLGETDPAAAWAFFDAHWRTIDLKAREQRSIEMIDEGETR